MTPPEEGMKYFSDFARIAEMKKKTKDHLKLLIQLTFDLTKYKIVKLCLIYVFCQYSFATSITLYHILTTFSKTELLKHGSFCGIQIFVQINLGAVIFLSDEIFEFMKSYRKLIIPFEIFEKNLLDKIMWAVKIIQAVACVNLILALIAASGFIFSPEYFNKKTYLKVWIREMFPEYSEFMLLIVSLTSLPVALVLAGSPLAWSYGGLSGIIQLFMFNQCVSRICTSRILPKFRRDSEVFQAVVKQKMIVCIMLHDLVIRYTQMGNDIIEIPVYLFSIGGVILGGSLMIEFLSNQVETMEVEKLVYMGVVAFTLAGVISANLYVLFGQLVKDESERTHYLLTQLPWYDLNLENRKIFLIFLRRTEKPVTFSSSVLQIDFLLLVRITKTLYSMAAILTRFVSLNS